LSPSQGASCRLFLWIKPRFRAYAKSATASTGGPGDLPVIQAPERGASVSTTPLIVSTRCTTRRKTASTNSPREVCQKSDHGTRARPYAGYRTEGGRMVRRGTPGPTPRRRTHGGVHGSRGTEIMAARWVFCFSDGHYWGCMMRDEQRGQLSKHPPLRFPLGAGGTSDPSSPKRVMASSSGKGDDALSTCTCASRGYDLIMKTGVLGPARHRIMARISFRRL